MGDARFLPGLVLVAFVAAVTLVGLLAVGLWWPGARRPGLVAGGLSLCLLAPAVATAYASRSRGKKRRPGFANLVWSANAMGIQLAALKVKSAEELDSVIETGKSRGVSALAATPLPLFTSQQKRIIDLAAKHRLPAIYSNADFVDAGGFMSYGPNLVENYRRAAVYVDKIHRGAKPADLPIEQTTKFEFIIS